MDQERAKVPPACQRCRLRKVKCDRMAPRCSHCQKTKATCIIIDPVTSTQYSRDEIRQLEEREKELRQQLEAREDGAERDLGEARVQTTVVEASVSPSASSAAFVGDASGYSLLRVILSDSRWCSCEPQLLRQLAERPKQPELSVTPNPLPPVEEASSLVKSYFDRYHLHQMFLARRHVTDIFNRVYHCGSEEQASDQDYFRLFMIFALGAVSRFRSGASKEHPFGYYLTAQSYLGNVPLVGSPNTIQNILLIARFGVYHHIGTSLWDLSRFAMRQAIEQNLHLPPQDPIGLLQEQHRRLIFWSCYVLDRQGVSVLGRPIAIADRDIQVELPIDASDEIIAQATNCKSLSEIPIDPYVLPSEMSAFLYVIKLRRITSKVNPNFYSGGGVGSIGGTTTPTQVLSSGDVYVRLYRFLEEMDTWRSQSPIFPHPSCLYQRPEWYDFLLARDKLLLVRSAIHLAPKRNGQPPNDLLNMSVEYATHMIELYHKMAQGQWISWTRTYFQVIFTAGLSVLYYISMRAQRPDVQNGPGLDTLEPTLSLCSTILLSFRKEMPDAGRFAIVFEILKQNMLREITPQSSRRGNTPQQQQQQLPLPYSPPYEPNGQQSVPHNLPYAATVSASAPTFSTSSSQDLEMMGLISIPTTHNSSHAQANTLGIVPEETLACPELTDEFLELLENGLGEYAWGMMDSNAFPWTESQWNYED